MSGLLVACYRDRIIFFFKDTRVKQGIIKSERGALASRTRKGLFIKDVKRALMRMEKGYTYKAFYLRLKMAFMKRKICMKKGKGELTRW